MTLNAQINRILTARIDQDNLNYRFSPLPPVLEDNSVLAASIRRVGILHPPILKKTGNDRYLIVAGHTRILLAVHHLGLTALPCLVLPPDCDEPATLEVAFEALCARRAPSPIETAGFCRRMLEYLSAGEIAKGFPPRPGLPPTPFAVNQAARLTELEEPFAVAVHQGRLHEAVGREFLELSLPDRLALFELIDLLQLSVGNQKKLVAGCRELSGRDKISLRSILGSTKIREILDHQGMNVPQKGAALMRYLEARRFPGLTAAEAEFKDFRHRLALPDNFTLDAAQSFEDDSVCLTITLPDRQTLVERLPALLSAGEQP